jgi:hypothetical protein
MNPANICIVAEFIYSPASLEPIFFQSFYGYINPNLVTEFETVDYSFSHIGIEPRYV